MAGSLKHVIKENTYRGHSLLENSRDCVEAIHELAFVILALTTETQRESALERYYRCANGKEPWPTWMGEDGRGTKT
jgi:hypothetical protein